MRFVIVLIIILLAVWYFMDRPEPVPVEESFIAEPVNRLREAEALNEAHLEQTRERQQKMEEALEGDGGN